MIVSVGGFPGAGKTTAVNLLPELFPDRNITIVRASDVFRNAAKARGITVEQLFLEPDIDTIHNNLDRHVSNLILLTEPTCDIVVADSRLSWYFFPESHKVMITASPDAIKTRSPNLDTNRANLERDSWLQLYGVDIHDLSNYDKIINTTNLTPEATARAIMRGLK